MLHRPKTFVRKNITLEQFSFANNDIYVEKKIPKKVKIWKVVFLAKNFFFQKIFFYYFSTLISNIFRKKFVFPRFEFSSSDVFKALFRKNAFFNIFLNIEPRAVKFGQDPLFLMLFTKKWQNSKILSFCHFLGKFDFWSIFVILKISWVLGKPKFFFHRFLIKRVLTNS